MWYSYKTCGGKDYWMTPEKKKELQVHLSSEKNPAPGCLGDLLGMKYYPVIWRF